MQDTADLDVAPPPIAGAGSANGHRSRPAQQIDLAALLSATPGLMRIAAGAWLRTAEWTLSSTLRTGSRLVRAAAAGDSATDLLAQAGSEARDYARRLLAVADRDADTGSTPSFSANGAGVEHRQSLRDRGAELLRRSADIRYDEQAHPAYERILEELAPDEGRILRFLCLDGAQPSVDVRAGKTLNVGSQLIAPGISMIGAQAGCRYMDRVPAYLNNLYRLGLLWFSRESLEDPLRYQVLEAQPEVVQALRGAGRGRTVRRSIHLTPFGEDFCQTCLPLPARDAVPGQEPF